MWILCQSSPTYHYLCQLIFHKRSGSAHPKDIRWLIRRGILVYWGFITKSGTFGRLRGSLVLLLFDQISLLCGLHLWQNLYSNWLKKEETMPFLTSVNYSAVLHNMAKEQTKKDFIVYHENLHSLSDFNWGHVSGSSHGRNKSLLYKRYHWPVIINTIKSSLINVWDMIDRLFVTILQN